MSFTKTFPIDTGTFVIRGDEAVDASNPDSLRGRLGSIACYLDVAKDNDDDDYIVMVSGYWDSWCAEYLLSELTMATDEQVEQYEKMLGIDKSFFKTEEKSGSTQPVFDEFLKTNKDKIDSIVPENPAIGKEEV